MTTLRCFFHRRLAGPARLIAVATIGLAISGLSTSSPSSASTKHDPHPCAPDSDITCEFGIPYVDDGRTTHTLDAYYPTHLTGRASVVIVHGGFWQAGSSAGMAPEARYFARNGFAAFAINFQRPKPGKPAWPAMWNDVEAATAWVMGHADEYHGDGGRVGVMGSSSGGHLAALLNTAGPENGVAPLATVSWSGPMDLVISYDQGNPLTRNALIQLLGCRPDECPETYADASPVTHVTGDDGHMLFFQSTHEQVSVDGARELNRALAAAGVPHRLVLFKHSTKHSREYECDPARVEGRSLTVIDDTVRWLGSQLDQPTTPTRTFCTRPTSWGR